MSTEVQVFLPKYRNKHQYKCLIERTFDEAIEESAQNSPQNSHKKTIIDVITPQKDLDEYLAQQIISIKPQSGSGKVHKISDLKSRIPLFPSCEQSPNTVEQKRIQKQQELKGYHGNMLYQNYKYKCIQSEFDKDLLNNTCDIVRNPRTKSKIKGFQFQLYHRKYQPLFELTEENVHSQTPNNQNDSIQINFQNQIYPREMLAFQQTEDDKNKTDLHKQNTNEIEIQHQIDKALIKTMKNSVEALKYSRTNDRFRHNQTEQKRNSRAHTNDQLNNNWSRSHQQEDSLDCGNQPIQKNSQSSLPQTKNKMSLPPIFTLDQFNGDIDTIHAIAKMGSKGKTLTQQLVSKQFPLFPISNINSPAISPSQKCRTENSQRKHSFDSSTLLRRKESTEKESMKQQRILITSPNEEPKEDCMKLDSLLKQQKIRNVQDISDKIDSQLKFNNNEIKEAMDAIRFHFWGALLKDKQYSSLTQEQLYYEFIQLCQLSHKILEMNRQNIIKLPQDNKKNQLKLMDLIKETDQTVLLEVMIQKFPFLKENINKLNLRVLESLNFNLAKQIDKSNFYTVGWENFLNFIRLAITKTAPQTDVSNFIVKQHKYIQVDDFLLLLKTICSKVDKYVDSKSKKNIYTAFEHNFKLLGLIRPGLSVFSSSQLRIAIMQNKINQNELLDLIFYDF